MKVPSLLVLLACLFFGACQSEPEKPNIQPKRMGEIPEDYSELWRAWLLQDGSYLGLQERARIDPQKSAFLVENLISVLLGELTAGRIDSGDPAVPTTYERARRELIRLGPQSTSALAEVLPLGLGMGPVAVEDLLVAIGAPSVAPLLGQLERTEAPLPRRRAVKALAALAAGGIPAGADAESVREALGQHLKTDDDWIVRSQCALALAPWGRRTAQDMAHSARFLVPALKDGDDSVRQDAVHGLARLGDPRTFPALINHLEYCENSGDPSHTMLVQAALRAMTLQKSSQTPAEWRSWWRDARSGILTRFAKQYGATGLEDR